MSLWDEGGARRRRCGRRISGNLPGPGECVGAAIHGSKRHFVKRSYMVYPVQQAVRQNVWGLIVKMRRGASVTSAAAYAAAPLDRETSTAIDSMAVGNTDARRCDRTQPPPVLHRAQV
jgi:hypothetical protein